MKFQAETCQSLYRLITFITLPFSYFSPNSSVQFHLPYCAGFLSPFSIVGTGHVPVRVQSRASGSCRRMTAKSAGGSGHGIDSAGGIPFVLEVEGNGVPAYRKRDKGAQHVFRFEAYR